MHDDDRAPVCVATALPSPDITALSPETIRASTSSCSRISPYARVGYAGTSGGGRRPTPAGAAVRSGLQDQECVSETHRGTFPHRGPHHTLDSARLTNYNFEMQPLWVSSPRPPVA